MKNRTAAHKANIRLARVIWGELSKLTVSALKVMGEEYGLLVARGDVQLLGGRWYVTHSGLLRIALRRHCLGISTSIQSRLCEPAANRWVFKAVVHKSAMARGFVGYGDADPSNVSSFVHGAELRIAETRAVNRALRKAYGIGLCSVEELGWTPRPQGVQPQAQRPSPANGNNGYRGTGNGQPRLRDRLCLLIRQHQLDADLVKAYAAHYCGTATLREASREMVESFITELAERAAKDRSGLICQLNGYAKQQEVAP